MREHPTFEKLVEEHSAFVRRTLAQLGVSARDLDDVEQEVFRGADRGLPRFDPSLSCNPDTAVRGWLFGICERQAASHRRKASKRGEVLFATEDLDSADSVSLSVEDRLIDHERKVLLNKLLDCLEPHRRAVVVAYELEGVAMADVAAALSIPVNTAWNRLRLGREDLRAAWKRVAAREKRERGVMLPSLPALFGGASWCSEGSGTIPASEAAEAAGAKLGTASGSAVPSVLMAPAQATFFGALAVAVPLAMTGMLVLGEGEEPSATPDAAQVPAVVAVAGSPTAGSPTAGSPTGSGPPGASAAATPGPALIAEASSPSGVPGGTEPVAAAGESHRSPSTASSGSATSASRGASRHSLMGEARSISEAAEAMERGDLSRAKAVLDAHQRKYPGGHLEAERELLAVRVLIAQGRQNEASNRARQFVSAHPDDPLRSHVEALVAKGE